MNSINKAYDLYLRYINDEDKISLLVDHKLKVAGSVPSVIWELFGSILTERMGSGLTGADLLGWEVKSAKIGGSFEYQYHLNTGTNKLVEDCHVNHLFCIYSGDYKDVTVRAMKGSDLSEKFFQSWIPGYHSNYSTSSAESLRRQRFRKNITASHVARNGELILKIENGKITYRDDTVIPRLNAEF